ncbi:3-oxoadipate enol-lactonase [soil metagenome]
MKQVIQTADEVFDVTLEGPADAPVVMLSNSLGTRHAMWDAQAAVLRERFRVLRYDPRGISADSLASGDFSIAQMGEDAVALMDALGIAQVHWCGISMGGAVGLWLLANRPERIVSAVIANSAPYFGGPANWAQIESVRASGLAGVAEGSSQRVFTPAFRAARPDVVESTRALIASAPVGGWAGCAAALRDMDLRGTLGGIRHPLLLIGSTDDLTTPWTATLALHETLPHAQICQLQAAHLSNIEQADAFNAAVLDFLPSGRA